MAFTLGLGLKIRVPTLKFYYVCVRVCARVRVCACVHGCMHARMCYNREYRSYLSENKKCIKMTFVIKWSNYKNCTL